MKKIALAIISGLGVALSFNLPSFSFLIWISLIPFFYLLNKKASLKGATYFLIFGTTYYGLTLYWVAYVSVLGFVLLIIYLSLFYLIFYLLSTFFIKRPLRQLAIPAAWVVVEFLKESIWCGFSWGNLGYSQFNNLYLIQIADIGGIKLISFTIVLINFLIWETIVFYRNKNKDSKNHYRGIIKNLFFLLLIFVVVTAYSSYRLKKVEPEEKITVSLIQPNILEKQFITPDEKKEILKSLSVFIKATPKESLIVLPEAAWPYLLDRKNIQLIDKFVRRNKRNIIIGAITKKGKKHYNSALFFNSEARLVQLYDKIKLVPFGEYVPLRKYLKFIKVLNSIGDIIPGKEKKIFSYQNKDFATLICFEDVFPYYVAGVAEDKDFLLNITDDSWFHGEPEATQHLSIMVLRAVENRISIVRAANSGISGWVSPKGHITKLKKNKDSLFIQAKEDFQVLTSKKRSFYNRRKGWFVLVSFIFLTVIFFKKRNFYLSQKA
ncbi:MAG: apolipoprotein N-acyltransferase [Candidatus Omnitrophica bacterium]|nr:apolipoprotein N-acyltransferase [Candidatus Omnitrophota bacterium]MCF7893939.1 apolipoprotein N-acyltransferase [Candidatus Omnitrophota bacterium]